MDIRKNFITKKTEMRLNMNDILEILKSLNDDKVNVRLVGVDTDIVFNTFPITNEERIIEAEMLC
jgi:hypothetical protein